jgi:NitT/TauT family transport system substrate-binding protein
MRSGLRLIAGTLAAALLLTACGDDGGSPSSSSGADAEPANLTFAIASAVIGPKEEVAVYAVAKELGYFSEEKLTVDTINTDGSVAALQAVASGSGDVTAADTGSILGAVSKNVPVKAVGGLVQNWPWVIATKTDSTYTRPADFKGKKIGVISLASGSAPYARAFVKAGGLDPAKDVELLPVGVGAQAATALNGGQVDALALYTQAYAVIENAGT